ncbi:MAG: hypothetical protein ACXWUH_12730 [Burkholderiales bacterium]
MISSPNIQSALHPQGPHAEAVADLGATMFWGSAAVALIVFGLAAYALWGPRKRRQWVSSGRFVVTAASFSRLSS